MKKLSLFLLTAVIFFGCSSDNDDNSGGTHLVYHLVNFANKLPQAESEFTTTDGVKDGDYMRTSFKDNDGIAEFNHYYSTTWGFGGGFTYTNKTDKTTPGYTNISAVTGEGVVKGQPYLTSNTNSFTQAKLINLQPDKYTFDKVSVTNTTYAYLAIKDGNAGYGTVKKFAAGDWFKLTITGYTASGTKIGDIFFYLADFRNDKSEIINTWKAVDLTSLSTANYLTFSLESTDTSGEYMNTPSYFCLDGLTMVEK